MEKMKNGKIRYIPGYVGRILNTPENRFFLKVLPKNKNGCMLWTGNLKKNGYGTLGVNGKNVHVHRFSYEYHYQTKIPEGDCVCHKCDNRNCVAPDHLFLGSHKDNMQDMFKKKRDYWSKRKILTDEQKDQIYKKILSGCNVKDLCETYKVSKSTCYKIFYQKELENEEKNASS